MTETGSTCFVNLQEESFCVGTSNLDHFDMETVRVKKNWCLKIVSINRLVLVT